MYTFKVTLKQDASSHCVEVGRLQSRVYYFSPGGHSTNRNVDLVLCSTVTRNLIKKCR